jgi:hypothetical protein
VKEHLKNDPPFDPSRALGFVETEEFAVTAPDDGYEPEHDSQGFLRRAPPEPWQNMSCDFI